MNSFPALDPIPLPAPIWLFKVLHTATLVLHFYAVQIALGGLIIATYWAIRGRFQNRPEMTNAAGSISLRLPIVMTFVINLGVPPLLFAQVLYGRAIYTSSVLIGVWWISVIALVIIAYSLMYVMTTRAGKGRAFGWVGVIALIVMLKVAMIYNTNMTLMISPEHWVQQYKADPYGLSLPSIPSIMPRWLYMVIGSLGISGIALLFLGTRPGVDDDAKILLRSAGGRIIALFTLIQLPVAIWVYRAQTGPVREALSDSTLYRLLGAFWMLTGLILVAGGLVASFKTRGLGLPSILALVAFLNLAAMVLFRDGIRDTALRVAGFNVWDQPVNTNWSIVILFLICFVIAVALVLWMGSLVVRAKPVSERYA